MGSRWISSGTNRIITVPELRALRLLLFDSWAITFAFMPTSSIFIETIKTFAERLREDEFLTKYLNHLKGID